MRSYVVASHFILAALCGGNALAGKPVAYRCTIEKGPEHYHLPGYISIISDGQTEGVPSLLDPDDGSLEQLLSGSLFQTGRFGQASRKDNIRNYFDVIIFDRGGSQNPFQAIVHNGFVVLHYIYITTYENTAKGYPMILTDLGSVRHGFCN